MTKTPQPTFQLQIRRLFKALSTAFTRGEVIQSAIVIAYYMLFSIFPIIIIAGNILPLFHISPDFVDQYVEIVFPGKVSTFVLPIVQSLLTSKSTGVLSFGVITAIWSFSSLVNAIRIGMNRLYGVHAEELKQNLAEFLLVRSVTVLLTTLMIVLFMVVALIFIFGQQILASLTPLLDYTHITTIKSILHYRYHVLIILMTVAIYYLNYALPNIRIKKRVIWPGLLCTEAGWLLLSWLFGYYLQHFTIRWENYGIVGTFILFMLWLNLVSLVLLFGTTLNVALVNLRNGDLDYSVRGILRFFSKKSSKRTSQKR